MLNQGDIDVVIADDGLQHHAMHRDIEIAVVDGQRLLGNQWLLPAGPLREKPARLKNVDVVAMHHPKTASNQDKQTAVRELAVLQRPSVGHFYLEITALSNLASGEKVSLTSFKDQHVHAVAGLGNPHRFFASLETAGLKPIEHAMPDHHAYVEGDLQFTDEYPILVTSKDAVKIQQLNMDLSRVFEVSVSAVLDSELSMAVDKLIAKLR